MHDFSSLPASVQAHIAGLPLDLLDTQHRCCLWADKLPTASFLRLRGYTVLLPIAAADRRYIQAPYVFLESNDPAVVFLLADLRPAIIETLPMTVLAVCLPVRGQSFFITIVYHHIQLPLSAGALPRVALGALSSPSTHR